MEVNHPRIPPDGDTAQQTLLVPLINYCAGLVVESLLFVSSSLNLCRVGRQRKPIASVVHCGNSGALMTATAGKRLFSSYVPFGVSTFDQRSCGLLGGHTAVVRLLSQKLVALSWLQKLRIRNFRPNSRAVDYG